MNSFVTRLILASIIMLFDAVMFFFPFGSAFIAYVIVFRPEWVKKLIDDNLYNDE